MRLKITPLLLSLIAASGIFAHAIPASAAVEVGKGAPEFTLPRQGGGLVKLADFRGHVVYLDFWASWCGPCRQSFPWMNQTLARFKSRGLEIVAVNVDKKSADVDAFLAKTPATFPVALDPDGNVPGNYGLKGMPTSFLIGADGKVQMIHASFKDSDRAELEARIEAELAKARP